MGQEEGTKKIDVERGNDTRLSHFFTIVSLPRALSL